MNITRCPGGSACMCCRPGCDCGCIEACPAARRADRDLQIRLKAKAAKAAKADLDDSPFEAHKEAHKEDKT